MISAISICNLALAQIAAEPIRTFEENNKRARLAELAYEVERDNLLARYDWPFARRYRDLEIAVVTDETLDFPTDFNVFNLPGDCLAPREIVPYGNNVPWQISERYLLSSLDEVKLKYTAKITDPTAFSPAFVSSLAELIAARLCQPITRDNRLCASLRREMWAYINDQFMIDANLGNDHIRRDDYDRNEPFVDPDNHATTISQN